MKHKFTHGESGKEVVRIGDYVHKALGVNYRFAHKVLRYLAEKGFLYTPRIKGIDAKGREIMTYIDGQPVVADPVPLEISLQAIKILRNFHDLLSRFENISSEQTICHSDYAPWNVLEKDGVIVGIIDFDELHIGRRVDDLSYAIWTFVDLGSDNQHFGTQQQIEQLVKLIKAYGSDIDLLGFTESIIQNQSRVLKMREEAVKKSTDIADREYQSNKVKLINKSIAWVQQNKDIIARRIELLN